MAASSKEAISWRRQVEHRIWYVVMAIGIIEHMQAFLAHAITNKSMNTRHFQNREREMLRSTSHNSYRRQLEVLT